MKKAIVVFLIVLMAVASVFAQGSSETKSGGFFDGDVKLIIPYGVGGTHDVVARKFAEIGNRFIKGNIYCEQETGGDGIIAATNFTMKEPNVRELLTTSYGLWYQKARLGDDLELDLSKIQPVGAFDDRSYLLYVRPGEFKNLEEFLEISKKRDITISGGAVGADAHLCAGALIESYGGHCRMVAYEGGAQQMMAMINGEVDAFVGTAQVGKQYLETGKAEALVCFKDTDFVGYKDSMGIVVPNVVSLGYPAANIVGGGFLSVTAGTKQAYVDEVAELIKKVWATDEFKKFMIDNGLNVYECYTPELDKHILDAQSQAKGAMKILGLVK